MYNFFLTSRKVKAKKIEKKEPQYPNSSFENFDKFSHYIFLRLLQDKNCENDLYFYAFIFLICQLGPSFYALFIPFFYGKADLYWNLDMNRIQICKHASYELEKNQKNDKQMRRIL